MSDPADLSNLRDLALPTEVPLWPPAPGWWIVAAAGIIAVAAFGMATAVAHYRRNAYRREALRALEAVDAHGLSAILKRAALAAWPRDEVASLSGQAWLAFLDRTGRTTAFTGGPARHIETLAFGGTASEEDQAAAFAAARHWLRHHHSDRGPPARS